MENTAQAESAVNPKPGNTQKYLLILLLIIVILIAVLYIVFLQKSKTPSPSEVADKTQPSYIPIMKVGEEEIYDKDLNTEIAAYPVQDESIRKTLLEKMVKDSIILQAAKADGIITLDSSIFNSSNKDYYKRIDKVEEVKKKIENKQEGIEGTIATIWFLNGTATEENYTKNKKIAFEKISKLHNDVKNKKITIKQAGEVIKNDSSLAQIDPAYKTNAYFDFTTEKNEPVTRDEEFNKALHKLKEGEISEIFTGKAKDSKTENMIEVNYHFGQIARKVESSSIKNFDDWLSLRVKKYEVVYY